MRPANAAEALRDRLRRKTAVVTIDVQHAFFASDGSYARSGHDTAPMRAALPAIARLHARARRAGLLLIHVRSESAPWLDWPEHVAPPRLIDAIRQARPGIRMLERGTTEVQFAEEAMPAAGEPTVTKHVFDAFVGTPLDWSLHRNKIETIVFAGFTSETCVETTVRGALSHGYAPIVAGDAVATSDPDLHAASLHVIAERIGIVASIDELVEAGGWRGE